MLPENHYTLYDDLDNDSISEKMLALSTSNMTAFSVYKEDRIIEQWNFKGTYDFWFLNCLFITGDSDNDGKKEIYVFTLYNDTILLNCISDFRNPGLSIGSRVISATGRGIKKADPFIIPAEMDDLDGDGIKELIFGISSGLSLFPRNVFAYYISKDSLVKSPESSYFISFILQADLNKDGKKEIIPYGYATSNVGPEIAKYHDHSSFLMVLDQNLKFLFTPIEFKGIYSNLTPVIINQHDNGNSRVAWQYYNVQKAWSTLYFVNNSGIITDSAGMSCKIFEPSSLPAWKNRELIPVYTNDGIGLLNRDLKLVKSIHGIKTGSVIPGDFDLDGNEEMLVMEPLNGIIHIFREDFSNGLSIPADITSLGPNLVSVKKEKGASPLICFQSGRNQYLYKYGKNPSYPFNYLSYPAIYLAILLFALLIKKVQEDKSRKKYETEKKISELQLAIIRNQLDPHFTFNVINSIIYSVEVRENEEATEQLRQFAGLYRNMLLSAGSTRRTIDEELEFCDHYLRLEKLRYKERFNYQISVNENVDRKYLIPKFLIQIHAENAVKHGLSALEDKGFLEIELKDNNDSIEITITDNGIGRVRSDTQEKSSTGRGLKTLEELFSVYNKYYKENISSRIIDLYDLTGKPSGTRVCISIRKNEKS